MESLDDLRGFTYEELRQEMTLYAFTGVQLKRLLRQAQKHEEEMSMSQMGGVMIEIIIVVIAKIEKLMYPK